jgi:transcriptional regulator with GAF, ATPase, and Fis domain
MAPGGSTVDEETVQRAMGEPTTAPPDAARLVAIYPPELTGQIQLGADEAVLGRKPGRETRGLRLEHPTTSRRHFAIAWDDQRRAHVGRDLGSRNGSRVNGVDVRKNPVELRDGSVLRLGDVLLVYERGAFVAGEDGPLVDREAVFGASSRVKSLRRNVETAAADPSAVLLVGETGTGKEFVAREIHRLSQRRGPFVAINCAALSPQLIESQLFGHAKGAFTGAQSAHEGLFRAADGGTLFLDEVGELHKEMQPKLLRALQEREVQPVGETRAVKVDVRVVSATLRDLTTMLDDHSFRRDLYARLSPWEIRVPSLRERRADILLWAKRLAVAWQVTRHREVVFRDIEANAAERIVLHDWPDNLRGLDRLVHRAYGDHAQAFDVHTPAPTAGDAPPADSDEEDAEKRPKPSKEELERVLSETEGSIRAAAKHFGRDRRQIYRWMEQYGLREKG